ncbi:MAG TPA: iron-containing redox enzyme family protein [Acidimicrobiales bacterium]|nr:iron-containing redox enzyme family protein [Acidimicrobiales bacterium]
MTLAAVSAPAPTPAARLTSRLELALATGSGALDDLMDAEPVDARDGALALAAIHDLFVAPVDTVRETVAHQHHRAIVALKGRLEAALMDRVAALVSDHPVALGAESAVESIRALAARDLVPPVYQWVADSASWAGLRAFLAMEGGPDGGFDDLVALGQIGLTGEPKLEMARNYWDEMGRGSLPAIHTELQRHMAAAIGLGSTPKALLPLEALDRSLLCTVYATNRQLQPELVGALGLIELQAGPRCRKVVRGLRRLHAGADALAFYQEHADADPRHGKAWLDHVVAPLSTDPWWAAGMVRGATYRSAVNAAFFALVADRVDEGFADRRQGGAAPLHLLSGPKR